MTDFFALFGVSPETTLEEIKKKIVEHNRKWSRMSNSAPRLEDRRTAENNLALIPEAESIFSSEASMRSYAKELEESQGGANGFNALFNEAMTSAENQNYTKAFQYARLALQQDPGNMKACRLLLMSHLANPNRNESLSGYCQQEAEIALASQNDPTLRVLLGDLYFESENWKMALKTYSMPNIPFEKQQKAGICHYWLNDYNRAIQILEAISDKDIQAYSYLADCYAKLH